MAKLNLLVYFNEPIGFTAESRDRLFDTMYEAVDKMSDEGIDNVVLAEVGQRSITLQETDSQTYPFRIMEWFMSGRGGLGWLATIDNLTKQYSNLLEEDFTPQEAIDRTQATLETYLAAPAPQPEAPAVIAPPKGIVARMVDYVASKF